MLLREPTDAELADTFNRMLDAIVAGHRIGCPSGTGLDEQTTDILNSLARQPMPKRPSDIAACRIEFARMLDGTHHAEYLAEEDDAWSKLLG